MVGAGAVVTHDVPPNAIVTGNPARITGYVDSRPRPARETTDEKGREVSGEAPLRTLEVRSARLHKLPLTKDLRGGLTFAEVGKHLPFEVKRYFVILDVPSSNVRGEHAHRKLDQFLVCVKGALAVALDDGKSRDEVILDSPTIGLHIPPMVWGVQYKYSPEAVLLVLASDVYDPDDYIRDYDEFVNLCRGSR